MGCEPRIANWIGYEIVFSMLKSYYSLFHITKGFRFFFFGWIPKNQFVCYLVRDTLQPKFSKKFFSFSSKVNQFTTQIFKSLLKTQIIKVQNLFFQIKWDFLFIAPNDEKKETKPLLLLLFFRVHFELLHLLNITVCV